MSDRIEALQTELAQLLEERMTALRATITTTEQLTREVLKTELEQESHIEKTEQLKATLMSLREAVGESRQTVQRLEAENLQLTRAQNELSQQRDALRETVGSSRAQCELLRQEGAQLQEENDLLQRQVQTLQDNIAGMKRLKEEHLLSRMELTSELANVSSGRD